MYEVLKTELIEKYPFCTPRLGFDPGLAVFSKYPILHQDTFMSDGLPNVIGSFLAEGKGEELYFVSSCTLPPFYTSDYERLQKQLNQVAEKTKALNAPIITMGDYNLVQWSNEIQNFRAAAQLKDSRRGVITPSSPTDLLSAIFNYPHDHIFFSKHFKCISFQNLSSPSSNHIGIQGAFQFNPLDDGKGEIQ